MALVWHAVWPASPAGIHDRSVPMMDVIVLAVGLVFFAATIAYAYACERL
ncbi:hypothetical protein [Bradyrhizobium sp. LHD-71]|nr:hypothetical protein [Bradyrhizobium sp. LHD-71]MDQ8727719.1 hypothetical protein [Bradyrhizobium sp. LHD-71]